MNVKVLVRTKNKTNFLVLKNKILLKFKGILVLRGGLFF